jgi:hypothetical protein
VFMKSALTNRSALTATALLSLVATVCLIWIHDGRMMHPDIAQAISAARNLLAGNGYSTSLLYYEEHYRQNAWPAPQTVFPIGFPALIAALGAIGVPFRLAAQILSTTGFAFMPLAICTSALRLGLKPVTAFLVATLWLCVPLNWHNVLEKQTEMLFMSATLCGVIVLNHKDLTNRRLLLAGLFSAIAVLLRYAGVFWIIAASLSIALVSIRHPALLIRRCLIFTALPGTVVAIAFWRNSLLIGNFKGGSETIVLKSTRAALENVYFAASRLTGLDQDDLSRGTVAEMLVLAGFLLLVALVLRAIFRQAGNLASHPEDSVKAGIVSVFAYPCVSVLLLARLEQTTCINLSPRMLLPLVPFVLLAGAAMVSWLQSECQSSRISVRATQLAASVLSVGLILAVPDACTDVAKQVPRLGMVADAIGQSLEEENVLPGFRAISSLPALSSENPTTPADYIRGRRILTNEPHMLPEVMHSGGVGLTAGIYTSRIWSSSEVRSLVQKYHLNVVVVFTQIPEPEPNPFFDLLIADRAFEATPDWLTPVIATEDLIVFVVPEIANSPVRVSTVR